MPSRNPDGSEKGNAQKQREKRACKQADAERERERSGLRRKWKALLKRIGEPPLDPVGNSEWANNMAAGMAAILAADNSIPLELQFKLVAEQIDRIAGTHAKALVAKEIREVREGAGVPTKKARHEPGVVQVGAGTTLRAQGRARSR